MRVSNVRFIERDYYKHIMASNSSVMTDNRLEKILDAADHDWADLTFRFFENGSLIIIDNNTDLQIPLQSLTGAAYEFYVKQRSRMIREKLASHKLHSA